MNRVDAHLETKSHGFGGIRHDLFNQPRPNRRHRPTPNRHPTDHSALYTPLTRGGHTNHAYIAVTDSQTGPDLLTHTITQHWADKPASHGKPNSNKTLERSFPARSGPSPHSQGHSNLT